MSRETILAEMLRTNEDKIKEALSFTKNYKVVRRPKKSGGYRVIYIPPQSLKEVQKRLYRYFLRKLWRELSVGFFGIQKKTSYVDHAKWHSYAKYFFQFDLKDAFPSVNVLSLKEIISQKLDDGMSEFEWDVSLYRDNLEKAGLNDEEIDPAPRSRHAFDDLGYIRAHKRAVINSAFFPLQHLLVKGKENEMFSLLVFPQREEIAQGLTELIIELTTFQGILPQGTPTAPFLFYLALTKKGLLTELNSVCPCIYPVKQDRYKFQVSAYIDNFVISAQKPIPLENQKALLKAVEECGFKVNPSKTWHQSMRHGAPLIAGLRITDGNGGKVVLSKSRVRRWRGLIHRAIYEPGLRPKVKGLISSLRPIYGSKNVIDWDYFNAHGKFLQESILPPQLEKPYQDLLLKIEQEGI